MVGASHFSFFSSHWVKLHLCFHDERCSCRCSDTWVESGRNLIFGRGLQIWPEFIFVVSKYLHHHYMWHSICRHHVCLSFIFYFLSFFLGAHFKLFSSQFRVSNSRNLRNVSQVWVSWPSSSSSSSCMWCLEEVALWNFSGKVEAFKAALFITWMFDHVWDV